MNLLLKSVLILDKASVYHKQEKDILIKDGIIKRIDNHIDATNKIKTIIKSNLYVSKGWFDSSVCFGEPGFEERESIENGLNTAALSGFTTVVLNTNTQPIIENKSDIAFVKDKASAHAVSLLPLGALTKRSNGEELAELFDALNAGAVGFYDYKLPISNPNLLKLALQYAQGFDGLICSYPQENNIAGNGIVNEEKTATYLGLKGIPYLAEDLQVARDLFLLEYTKGKLHIPTISTKGSVGLIREAKRKGLNISCSTTIHHLFYTDQILEGFDSNTKVLPPLRAEEDQNALIEGVLDGTIDMVTSDHNPLNIELKKVEFDNAAFGTIGLESAFGALNKIFDTENAIDILTRGMSRFGMESPPIKEGIKANLTLFDPDIVYTFKRNDIYSTSKNSIFIDQELKGKPLGIIANDQFITTLK
ncbi:dihydroorotase [Ascidiimonas sp. W6]|uniref:dihydroorotase n=1 Tax=Ascidiimonas meishanensis TaxID=3128903 RepID=UPI0030EDEB7C